MKKTGCRKGEILVGEKCIKDKDIYGVPADVHHWLDRYMFGTKWKEQIKSIKIVPSDQVIMRSSIYGPRRPKLLYRAEPKKDMPKPVVSYTYDKEFAEHLVKYSDGKLVLKSRIISPSEIIIDTTSLPEGYKTKYLADMDEVIVARGKLKEKIKELR